MICARKGCKNELQSPLKGPAKYCKDPLCVHERLAEYRRDYYRANKKGNAVKKKPASKVKIVKEKRVKDEPAPVKKKRDVWKKDSGFDCDAKMRNWDRGTREGFKKYMEENPIYFASVFKGMTVASAWRSMAR